MSEILAKYLIDINNNLGKIAKQMGSSNYDITTWAGIQKAVRAGVAPEILPIGTQLNVNHSVYGEHLYDVVAHNYLKSATDKNAPTMTLLCHDQIGAFQFDSAEAFYYASAALPAGTYNFTISSTYSSWEVGTYQFTTTTSIPEGGQICIDGKASTAMTSVKVTTYASQNDTTPLETLTITSGSSGTSLGTFGTELNHAQRISYGSNNYKESAIRQFLNSPAVAGSVWTPQTKFDRPPSWNTTLAGFESGLESDFLAVVGDVIVPCAANNTYESPDSIITKNTKYTVTDKFYLPSQKEIFGSTSNTVVDDSVLFPYYEGATNADRIKYRNGSALQWWGRSAREQSAYTVHIVSNDGSLTNYGSVNAYGCSPACTIV